jgi:hypothetical protein
LLQREDAKAPSAESAVFEQFVDGEPDVFGYLPEQSGRDIAARVKRNRRAAPGTVAKLLMRTTLSHVHKAQPPQNGSDFGRLQNWNVPHVSSNADVLYAHELRLEFGLAILQQHGNDFLEVEDEFIERRSLGVGTPETGDETNEQARLRIALNNCAINLHGWHLASVTPDCTLHDYSN